MKIVEMKPSELKPYYRNNRKHPQTQIDKLAKQISAHGWDVPIVVDKDFVIIKGHGRHKAAKQLKLKTVPVIVRDDLTPEQCNAARLADNKLSELAEIDMESIQAELDALKLVDFDLDLTAFDSWNLEETKEDKEIESKIQDEYSLIVICQNEADQQDLFNELQSRMYEVKIP